MAAQTWALISDDEFRDRYVAGGQDQSENVDAACNIATLAIEARCGGRQFVSRGTITEYHSIYENYGELYAGDWPFLATPTVVEDTTWPRTYAATALVSGTDFEVVDGQKLRRINSGGRACWAQGSRVVRLTYTAGYATTAAVPWDLKHVAFVLAASIFGEADKKRWGVSSQTDGSGAYQRYSGYFNADMDSMLASYVRRDFHRTWERAA